MLFNSIHFLLFFPLVVALYFALPHRFRWVLLLGASYYFYMTWNAKYIILIIISTLIDYIVARKIYSSGSQKKKKVFLGMSLISNLGLLFTFKYFNFFNESITEALQALSINVHPFTLKVLLPVGISFYTFQTLSYTIDVYRGKIKPENHLGIFAVYVSFFPQLVAGPIERAKNFLPQFSEKHRFQYTQVTDGLKLMLWGFFKKIVIADHAAIVVDAIYNSPFDFTGLPLLIATLFFGVQIYCDFSGYSDIAIGAAQVMGFRLMDNFKRPYFAQSVSDFWRRWHISLSSWFKDYVYIPLGGNRVSVKRLYINLFVVFLVSGLWHGANWTFVLWGALHGTYMVISLVTKKIREKCVNITRINKLPSLHKGLKILITFSLVNVSWIFFRANSVHDAWYILTHMFTFLTQGFSKISLGGIGIPGLIITLAAIGIMEFVHIIQEHQGMRHFLSKRPLWVRWSVYYVIIFAILLFGAFENKDFIYFQF